MNIWTYQDQDGQHNVSEEEILATYYPYWQDQMKRVGKEAEISPALCIQDWVTVHWAWQENTMHSKQEVQ